MGAPFVDVVRKRVNHLAVKVQKGILYADMLDEEVSAKFNHQCLVRSLERSYTLQGVLRRLHEGVKVRVSIFCSQKPQTQTSSGNCLISNVWWHYVLFNLNWKKSFCMFRLSWSLSTIYEVQKHDDRSLGPKLSKSSEAVFSQIYLHQNQTPQKHLRISKVAPRGDAWRICSCLAHIQAPHVYKQRYT